MSNATFNVVFRGRLVGGYSENTVKSNLARTFKLTAEQMAELFSGKEVVIKSGLSIETARQLQSAFVRQGAVTILRKVANGEAAFGGGLWQVLCGLGYYAMSLLSIVYRGCVKRFPAVEQHLESILSADFQNRLANGVSRPPTHHSADRSGARLPAKQQLRELSTKFLRRIPGSRGRSLGKRSSPRPSTKPRRRARIRLPRFGPILRRLKSAAIIAVLAAGVAGAVIYWPSDLQWTVIRAKLGSQPAQLELAFRYREGDGVVQDDARAVHWFRVAAERGHAGAQNELGTMYEKGRGVSPDLKLAATWYGKAARQGQAEAQHNLGELYQTGRGVRRDEARAVVWYRKAAEQGHMEAQNKLGIMYQQGRGVKKDEAQAAYWYGKAASQGYAWAQTNLGYLYEHGRGVKRDPKLAALWYQKAAKQGHETAQKRLERM